MSLFTGQNAPGIKRIHVKSHPAKRHNRTKRAWNKRTIIPAHPVKYVLEENAPTLNDKLIIFALKYALTAVKLS